MNTSTMNTPELQNVHVIASLMAELIEMKDKNKNLEEQLQAEKQSHSETQERLRLAKEKLRPETQMQVRQGGRIDHMKPIADESMTDYVREVCFFSKKNDINAKVTVSDVQDGTVHISLPACGDVSGELRVWLTHDSPITEENVRCMLPVGKNMAIVDTTAVRNRGIMCGTLFHIEYDGLYVSLDETERTYWLFNKEDMKGLKIVIRKCAI